MKKNVGALDRIIRFIIAAVIAVLYFAGIIEGTVALILGIAALVLVITGVIGWCGLYMVLGISTRKDA